MIQAGVAKFDMTPEPALPMAGYPVIGTIPDPPKSHGSEYVPRRDVSEGTLDGLHGRVLVLNDGLKYVVMVALDLCVVDSQLTREIRAAIHGQTGLEPDNVMVSASHTHSAHDVTGLWSEIGENTRENLVTQVAEGTADALGRMQRVRVGGTVAKLGDFVVNRFDATGPTDAQLPVLVLRGSSGDVLSMVVNATAHPVCLAADNLRYSGDWPGALRTALESLYPGCGVVFVNGAAGNINPVGFPVSAGENIISQHRAEVAAGRKGVRTREHMGRLGRLIAAEVCYAVETLEWDDFAHEDASSVTALSCSSIKAELPLKSESELSQFFRYLGVTQAVQNRFREATRMQVEVQAIRIGRVMIVSLPGEPFVEIGLRIKQASQSPITMVVGYANDDPRYIPTSEAFEAKAYETLGTPVDKGSDDVLVQAALEAMERIS